MAVGKNIIFKNFKREAISSPYNDKALGKNNKGKGTQNLGKIIKNSKKWGGENIKL